MLAKKLALACATWITTIVPFGIARAQACEFDRAELKFAGSPRDQARCLLRTVEKGGVVGSALATLPEPLASKVGTPADFSIERLRALLLERGLTPDALGGSLEEELSRSSAHGRPTARYFVIHDTSWNLCEEKSALTKGDDPDSSWNRTSRWSTSPAAHLFITRDGKLVSPQGRTFATPWRATKLESLHGVKMRGLFLHIENVQLRYVEPAADGRTRTANGLCLNDRLAQRPGFSDAQMDRLALTYLAASYRAGEWLVPALHAVIDQGLSDGHDDPQNFDLKAWGARLCAHLQRVGGQCTP